MAFVKKIFEDGNEFTADDANMIQEQYDESIKEIDERQTDFALSLYNEVKEGNGINRVFFLENTLISQPIIVVKRTTDSFYRAETISEASQGLDTQWFYYQNTNEIAQNFTESTLTAGSFVRIGYVLRILPHADTHKTGGSDPINVNDIGGLTAAQINAIAQESEGISAIVAEDIAAEVKRSSEYAAVCRTVLSPSLLQTNEIAVL